METNPRPTVLIFDLQGSGFNVFWTIDGKTWIAVCSSSGRMFANMVQVNRYLKNCHNGETTRTVVDFWQRIPEDLRMEGTRVI